MPVVGSKRPGVYSAAFWSMAKLSPETCGKRPARLSIWETPFSSASLMSLPVISTIEDTQEIDGHRVQVVVGLTTLT